MIYKSLLKSTMLFSAISGLSPLAVSIKKHNVEESNLVADIANKYESATINPKTINYNNILSELKNSAFNSNLKQKIDLTWDISEANKFDSFFFYYDSAHHGPDSENLYEKALTDGTINTVDYMALLTIISHIAHYYGDNMSMDQNLRKLAISEDIGILTTMNQLIQNKKADIGPDTDFGKKVSHWSYINASVINDALTNNWSNDELLSNYNNLNYDQLTTTYNGNLHFFDDFIYSTLIGPYKTGQYCYFEINDWFHLGNSNDHNFLTISMSNYFYYYVHWYYFYDQFDAKMTIPPYNFDIQI